MPTLVPPPSDVAVPHTGGVALRLARVARWRFVMVRPQLDANALDSHDFRSSPRVPPNLDIYALTRRRDRRTVERFIASYVDREASNDRTGEELMMLALDAAPGAEEGMDKVEWLPVATLADILTHGLSRPSRAFAVRLCPQSARFSDAYLAFTRDDQLVIGLSLDDEGMLPANQAEAERVMHRLMQDFDGHRGLVGAELPAPLSEAAFARATPTLIAAAKPCVRRTHTSSDGQ